MFHTENDAHMQTWEADNRLCQSERQWERFVDRAEKLLGLEAGHLDENEDQAGYSIDGAYDAFQEGYTVEEYVELVKAKMATLPASLPASS